MHIILAADSLDSVVGLLTSQSGVITILVIIIVSFVRRWVVPNWVVEDKERECEMWKQQSERWMQLALRGTDLAQSLTQLTEPSKPS